MKKIINILTITVISISSVFAQVTENRNIEGFTGVNISSIIEVVLTQGNEYSVEVIAQQDNLHKIKTELNGNILSISTDGKLKKDKPKILITSPKIDFIKATGSSDVKTTNVIKEERLNLKASGVSNIDLSIKVDNLTIKSSGATNIDLEGFAKNLNATSSGAVDINAEGLNVMNADVKLTGASNSQLNVSDEIKGGVSGAAHLKVIGEPTVQSVIVGGVASIKGLKRIDSNQTNNTTSTTTSSTTTTITSESDDDNKSTATVTNQYGDYKGEDVEITNDIVGDIIVKEHGDTTRVSIGNKKILIIDGWDKTKVDLDLKDSASEPWSYGISGLILGVNGFLNNANTTKVPATHDFLETDIARSHNVQLNFLDANIKLVDRYVTLHPGLGLEFNSYEFRKDYRIQPSSGSNEKITAFQEYNSDSSLISYDKNRLKDTYLNVPLMLAFHTNKDHKKAFHLGIGGYAGLRIASKMKYKYKFDGEGTKQKVKDDYYLSSFRYGLTTSIGYSNINLFANYALNGLFEDNKGPALHPFSVGLMVVGW